MLLLYMFAWWYSQITSLSIYAFIIHVCMVILSNYFPVRICLHYTWLHCDTVLQFHCTYMPSIDLFARLYSQITSCPCIPLLQLLHGDTLIQLHCPYIPSIHLFAWWYSHTTSMSRYTFNRPVCMVILSYNFNVRICLHYTCLHDDTLKHFISYIPLLYLFAWWYSHTTSLSMNAFIVTVCMVILSYTFTVPIYLYYTCLHGDTNTTSPSVYAFIMPVYMMILTYSFTVRICLQYTCLHSDTLIQFNVCMCPNYTCLHCDTLIQLYCQYMPSLNLFAWSYSHTTLSVYALIIHVCMVILSYNFTVRMCLQYTCLHDDTLIQLHCPYMPLLHLFAWWYFHTTSLPLLYFFAWWYTNTTSLSVYAFILPVCMVITSYNFTVRTFRNIPVCMLMLLYHFSVRICLHNIVCTSLYLFLWWYYQTTSLSCHVFIIPPAYEVYNGGI